jgi:transposase
MDGARTNALAYSIIETARRNKADPYFYVQYIMENMPKRLDLFDRLAD